MKVSVTVILIIGSILLNDAVAHQCERTDRDLWRVNREYKRTMALVGGLFNCLDRSNFNDYRLQDRAQCHWFTGLAIDTLYGLDSFREDQGYLSASSMAQKIHAGEIANWSSLGALNNSFYGCRLSFALSKDKMANTSLFTINQNP